MLRINYNSLIYKNGKYFFNNSPYSGVAFRFECGVLKEKFEFLDGLNKGLYRNQILQYKDLLEVHMEETLSPADYSEVPYYINGDENTGEEFTGVAYSFEGDYCIRECIIKKWVESETCFSKTGSLLYADVYSYTGNFENEWRQTAKYDESGQILELNLTYLRGLFKFNIIFDNQNKFKSFEIKGDYFKKVVQLIPELIIPIFESKETITNYQASSSLFLSSDGINKEMMEILLKNNLLKDTKELSIGQDVYFYNDIFDGILENTCLEKLDVDTDNAKKSDLFELKKKMPNCKINYFGKTI